MNIPNEEFYVLLESHITRTLSLSGNPKLKGFWCDGVLPPVANNDIVAEQIVCDRSLQLTGFIGKTGQDRYLLTLHFGPKSISRLARDLTLDICFPTAEDGEWIRCDPAKKTIDVTLL